MPLSALDQKLIEMATDVFSLAGVVYRDNFGSDKQYQKEFCRRVAERFAEKIGRKVINVQVVKKAIDDANRGPRDDAKIITTSQSDRARKALSIAEEIIDLSESADLPDNGMEFAESVAEKARSISENIEENNFVVSDGQYTALENMLDGLQRWFHD